MAFSKTLARRRAKKRAAGGAFREIVTPEGVPLKLELADRGERAGAILIDLFIMMLAILLMWLAAVLIIGGLFGEASAYIVVMAVYFVLRSFYFIYFELRWHGRTPGKKAMGIRVIDRSGGRLLADAVFARNLTREVELFLPITLVFMAGDAEGISQWLIILSLIWTGALLAMPFFNRDRLRLGDIVANTMVVRTPEPRLLADLVADDGSRQAQTAAVYQFSSEQLGHYGNYELQTLERVLRQTGKHGDHARGIIAERIAKKIKFASGVPADSQAFLDDYYRALRHHLEKGLLMGRRKKNKFDFGTGPKT